MTKPSAILSGLALAAVGFVSPAAVADKQESDQQLLMKMEHAWCAAFVAADGQAICRQTN
jgi:hypothetical protein